MGYKPEQLSGKALTSRCGLLMEGVAGGEDVS